MNRLRQLAEQSQSAQELVEAMKQENLSTIKNAMLEWMREESESSPDGGLIGDPGVEVGYKDDGVRLTKDILDNAGLLPGDRLRTVVKNGKITLEKA
jgi:hypothetical protein